MKNLLFGFLLGILVATGAGVWAQSSGSGSVFDYGPGNIKTFRNSDGTTGSIFPYTDTFSSYQDSTGRSGSIYTPTPGAGVSIYSFSGGEKPC